MKAIRYTIRNIPEPVNRYLRQLAKSNGQSLNQTVINVLSESMNRSHDNLSHIQDVTAVDPELEGWDAVLNDGLEDED
jgi:hypothetical protein